MPISTENSDIQCKSSWNESKTKRVKPFERSVSVEASPDESFQCFVKFGNISQLMNSWEAGRHGLISQIAEFTRTKPEEKSLWNASVHQVTPPHFLKWHGLKESGLELEGEVRFSPIPNRRGTIISMSVCVDPLSGKVNEAAVAFKKADQENLILSCLKNVKALLETGRMASIAGQASSRAESASLH